MKRRLYFLLLALCLFFWMHMPISFVDTLRSYFVFSRETTNVNTKEEALLLENQLLRSQCAQVLEWLQFDTLCAADLLYMPAKVIYRDPSAWSSSLWINRGYEHNQKLTGDIISKNSPVLSDNALIGVIDYVGKRQSRVRLITDSGIMPAVKAMRGNIFIARGIVQGSSASLWRSLNPVLKGIGFSIDFSTKNTVLQENDTIVTSGLDGVFPEGIIVGTVTKVVLPREGNYTYEIEVTPSAKNCNDLKTVFILPAIDE